MRSGLLRWYQCCYSWNHKQLSRKMHSWNQGSNSKCHGDEPTSSYR